MLSIRTQDRMALVPYDSAVYIEAVKSKKWLEFEYDVITNYENYMSPFTQKRMVQSEVERYLRHKRNENLSFYYDFSISMLEFKLGTYATKERALEVLDEIEQHTVGKMFISENVPRHNFADGAPVYILEENEQLVNLPSVYQMPKE